MLNVLAIAAAVAGCSTGAPSHGSSSQAPAHAHISITVESSGSGSGLRTGFIGLGVEANTLARNEFPETDLGDYLRILAPHGLLRVGGNSVESFWTSTGEAAPAWSHGRITPASLRGLARSLRGTGWQVILGVPFKHSSPARAADEAKHAQEILGPRLRAIEIGNEPNHYGITESTYFAAFERYVRAIHDAVPGVPLAGPAMGRDAPQWVSTFARDEAPHPDIALFTTHEYPLSICNGEHPTIAQLLSTAVRRHEAAAADSAVAGARVLHIPAVIGETNSVVCWGAPGVSNTYASALWILDYGLLLAQHGVAAANFQTRISGCTPYLPLCTRPGATQLYARPEFYGLLALAQLGNGRFLTVRDPASSQLRAYAIGNGTRRLTLVLDNLGAAATVSVHLGSRYVTSAREAVLKTGSARGLAATSDITLGGRRVGQNARLLPPIYTTLIVSGTVIRVGVRAHTAAILKLS